MTRLNILALGAAAMTALAPAAYGHSATQPERSSIGLAADAKAMLASLGPQADRVQIETGVLAVFAATCISLDEARAALRVLGEVALTQEAAVGVANLSAALNGPEGETILANACLPGRSGVMTPHDGGAGQAVDATVLASAGISLIAALGDAASPAQIEAALMNTLSTNASSVQVALLALRILENNASLSAAARAAVRQVADNLVSTQAASARAADIVRVGKPPANHQNAGASDYSQ